MAGLCEGGNEPPGSLKAISNAVEQPWRERDSRDIVARSDSCAFRLLLTSATPPPPSHALESNSHTVQLEAICSGITVTSPYRSRWAGRLGVQSILEPERGKRDASRLKGH
ncbi:hypothetical protein ANN_13975 [Periplaneta americana]|uniref:Uncharacterized protein n=1 Tax=Periplaneta americana TaxID=6978 RepID=A0ABQ8SW88_PERAM|nr:hypothetical protein ANN_13975 [Periplaneta americana]